MAQLADAYNIFRIGKMNRNSLLLTIILALPVISSMAQSGKLMVINNSGVSRKDDPVTITRQALEQYVSIPTSGKRLVLSINGNPIPSQLDDLNLDGIWDELAFQIDIDRNSSVEVKLKWVDPKDIPVFPKKVQLWFGVDKEGNGKFEHTTKETRPDGWMRGAQPPRYQMEGPSWENDKLGFRQYFDIRNQKDLFGKTRNGMVLDSVDRFYTTFNQLQPWGMDLLHTESTLGAGSFAMIDKGMPVPIRKTEYTHYQEIANGPARAIFEIVYEGWKVGDTKYNLKERISIWAGKYWFKNEIIMTGFTGEKEIAVGISNLKSNSQVNYKANNMAFMSLNSHGRQSENEDMLGMGILFSSKIFGGYGETPKYDPLPKNDSLSHSFYANLKIRSGQSIDYQFFACWEKTEAKFGNAKYFTDVIQEEADRKEYPLTIGKK